PLAAHRSTRHGPATGQRAVIVVSVSKRTDFGRLLTQTVILKRNPPRNPRNRGGGTGGRGRPADHGMGSRSQILIEATSMVAGNMTSRVSCRVATARWLWSVVRARSTTVRGVALSASHPGGRRPWRPRRGR